jgi:predicted nucleic acid-binding protein
VATKPKSAEVSLSSFAYDGTAGVMVDSNVWIDLMDVRSARHAWAVDQLDAAGQRAALHINPLIYAELLIPGTDSDIVDAILDVYNTSLSPLPYAGAALAAAAFAKYRNRGGVKNSPTPDFYIGSHAAVENLSVLTRDNRIFSSYFPTLKQLSPLK